MKAILLMDMPKNCDECILCDYSWWCVADKEERKGNDKQRPEWCPLKPLPQKRILPKEMVEGTNYGEEPWFSDGFNACIDEILGDTE